MAWQIINFIHMFQPTFNIHVDQMIHKTKGV
jgi:hypothetical protein